MKANDIKLTKIKIIILFCLLSISSCQSSKRVMFVVKSNIQEKDEDEHLIPSSLYTYTYNENSVYEVDISPNKILDICLESGEIPSEKIAVLNSNFAIFETLKTNQDNQDTYHVMIRALQEEGETIMLLPTSKRIYHLKLNIKEDIQDVKLSFNYQDEKPISYLKNIKRNISTFSFSYSVKGNKEIAPEIVFSDTKATYFKFSDNFIHSNICPALFLNDGSSLAIINYSISGKYYIANFILNEKESFVFILDNKKAQVTRTKK